MRVVRLFGPDESRWREHGVDILGANGGDAEANGFSVSTSETTILGFSFTGSVIPAGSGVMQHYYTLKEDVATGGLIFNKGKVTIDEKPGLGIKLRKRMLTPA